jgi:Notch-like protein
MPPLCNVRAPYCSTVTCQNGGTCYNTGTYTGICVCPTSATVTYSGTLCEFQSQCGGTNPCQNGNQCNVINNLPYCFCSSQYTGVYCEAFLPRKTTG